MRTTPWWPLLLLVLSCRIEAHPSMPADMMPPQHRDLEAFKRRIGYPTEPDPHPDRILAVDWRALLPALTPGFPGMSLDYEGRAVVLADVLPEQTWVLKGAAGKVLISATVAGGPDEARTQMLASASATMMSRIPYERGPQELGDFSIGSMTGQSQVVFWSQRNIFMRVDNDASGFEIKPVAVAIQRFLESREVQSAAQRLPRIESFAATPTHVRVGQEIAVSVALGATDATRGAVLSIGDASVPRHLERVSADRLTAVFRASVVGRADIAVRLMDPITLLSSTRRVAVDIVERHEDAAPNDKE